MDFWFYIGILIFGIGVCACAYSSNRTVAIWACLSLAITAVVFLSTPIMNDYFVQYVQEAVTNDDAGWIGSLLIAGGIGFTNWRNNRWVDSGGITMILIGAILFTSAGFANPVIANFQELVPATRPTLIEIE